MGLGVVTCVGWHILVSLPSLVICPLPLGPAALAASPEPSLGPWQIFHCVPVSGPLECLLQMSMFAYLKALGHAQFWLTM